MEPGGYLVNHWQERSGGGASRPEAILGVGELEARSDEAEHEQVHHLSTGYPPLHKVRVQTEVMNRLDGAVVAPLVFWKSTQHQVF